jgi:serine carboxypeptidase-like clade 2
MNDWFLLPETLAAIGAPKDTNFINLDNGHGFNYTSDQTFVGPIYERAIREGLQVMVYEGDVDACGLQTSNVEDVFVPLFDDVIGLKQTREWRPWTTDGVHQMGGYVIEWERGVRFVSVRGSGHLVPLNRPDVSEVMINAFTRNASLPVFEA